MNKKKRVLVAMSGGIDSSISAFLLKQQGFDVIGITLKLTSHYFKKKKYPFFYDYNFDIHSARKVCHKLNIPHYVVDISEEFNCKIVDYFINSYTNGSTPNPCVKCNLEIKWKTFYELSEKFDCNFIATGHYSKVKFENNRYFISIPDDLEKDQSSFLWRLPQNFLAKALFPLSELKKTKVREIAQNEEFMFLKKKKESYNICFINDEKYFDFIERNSETKKTLSSGIVIDSNGKEIGIHKGCAYYTIGQQVSDKLFVKEFNISENKIIVDLNENIFVFEIIITDINIQKFSEIPNFYSCKAKIRYREDGNKCIISKHEKGNIVKFLSPIRKPANGQSVVFFEDNDLVGGGIIIESK